MAPSGDGEVLEEGRLRGVIDLFERLRERPGWPAPERLRPVLLLLGTGRHTRRVTTLFKERCEAERAPASHISASSPARGIPGLLREAMHELSQSTCRPRWEPALRFPHLEMALWLRDLREIRLAVRRGEEGALPPEASAAERENHRLVHTLTNPPVGDNENSRRRELNRVIRSRGRDMLRDVDGGGRGRVGTFLGFLEQIAPIGVAAVALVSAGTAAAVDLVTAMVAAAVGFAFVLVQVVARARGWYGVLRYGWFRRQPYLSTGARVARQIRDLALEDRTIVAVVGFEQSREQTRSAIRVLTKSALPLIGTANSYDEIARLATGALSPYFFRLASPNSRTARHAAFWAREGLVGGEPADSVDVLYVDDPDDLYSEDLADRFAKAFGKGVREHGYKNASDVASTTARFCRDPADLFYYAGRADEFAAFTNALEKHCGRFDPVVLADDEIAKYVSDHARSIGRKSYRLYYTPLALREAWDPRWVGGRRPHVLFGEFERVAGELDADDDEGRWHPSETRAAVSYDATAMITSLANRIYAEQQTVPTASAVFAALNEPGRVVLPKGASGVIAFTSRSVGHKVIDKPVQLATVLQDGSLAVRAVCGRLVLSDQGRAPCPPARDE